MHWFIKRRHKAVLGLLMGLLFGLTPPIQSLVPAAQAAGMSKKEKQQLVEQGVTQYKEGRYTEARQTLEAAKTAVPENYAVPFFLGLIYLKQENHSAAITEWQRYVALNPDSEDTLDIRKGLTLLLREQAEAEARQAVAREAALASGPVADNAVAVTAFKNLGAQQLGPLGKGMAAMLIHDLSLIPDLKVVERVKLQALLSEMDLGTSGIVNQGHAPKVGQLLGVKHVTSGSLADMEMESLLLASTVINAQTSVILRTQDIQGPMDTFYTLEKELACRIVSDLGKNCDSAPKAFRKIHTKSLPAFTAYSQGLDYIDKEQYDLARASFQKALDEDPDFDMAKSALLATPLGGMTVASLASSISSSTAAGVSAAAAGSATAAGTGVGTGTIIGAAAGALALGGGLAFGLSAGGDGGGGDPRDLTGEWQGTWQDTEGDTGTITLSLTQTNDQLSGQATLFNSPCLSNGSVTGSVAGNDVTLTLQSGTATARLNFTISSDTYLSGDVMFTSGTCSGEVADADARLTGGAVIHW